MEKQANPMQRVFRSRNFRLIWAGQGLSLLGDQFEMIAAPWLVLQLTKDPLALGVVLALSSIPRAIFMLVGGAVSDRVSPRTIMLTSDAIRMFLTASMAALIFSGGLQIWMLYIFALIFGVVGGFFGPAAGSILPRLVEKDDLQAGNSLVQGTAQLTNFLGPVLAGVLIAAFASSSAGTNSVGMAGIALAFGLDAVSFLVSIVTLLLIRMPPAPQTSAHENVLAAIKEGIVYAWDDSALKVIFIVILAANFLFVGPLLVGMPVLAQTRLAEGAVAFGLVMSAYGGGNLAGILLAGALPRPKPALLNLLMIVLVASFGVALVSYAFITWTWLAFTVMLVLGVGNGYFSITLITMLQQRTPGAMMGRIMSLIYFANVGLVPVSQALSGLIIKYNLEALFVGAGVLMVAVAGWMLLNPAARSLGESILAPLPAAE
jgi:MFS family permease